MKNFRNKIIKWMKLDNAAQIYPSASNSKWNSVFRVSVYLKEDVNADLLQKALEIVIERFPHLDVTLRRGLFWHYFENMQTFPHVQEEVEYPCRKMEINKKNHLFRVLYFKNKISFETFHSLTDGYGAVCFLNTLVACYLSLLGKKITTSQLIADYNTKSCVEEQEDSFKRFSDNSGTTKRSKKRAYQIYGTPERKGKLNVITIVANIQELKNVAKQKKCTITELLVAIHAMSILEYQRMHYKSKKPVIINVPINLRRLFNSRTLRNFSSWIDVTFERDNVTKTLDDFVDIAKHTMKQITVEQMLKNINANIKAENNFFVKAMPLFIKNVALKFSYKRYGEGTYSSVITNLGEIKAPDEFKQYVERYDCLLCKSLINTTNIAVASFNDKISLTFTSCIKEKNIQQNMIRALVDLGLSLTVYTNIM